jgi:hypothetical protein
VTESTPSVVTCRRGGYWRLMLSFSESFLLRLEVPDTAALLVVNLAQEQSGPTTVAVEPAPAPVATAPVATLKQAPPPGDVEPQPFVPGNAGLFYPLATNYGNPRIRTHFDLGVLYGLVGELDGLQLGTVNTVHGDARGMQIGVLVNADGGTLRGVQIAGLLNAADASEFRSA